LVRFLKHQPGSCRNSSCASGPRQRSLHDARRPVRLTATVLLAIHSESPTGGQQRQKVDILADTILRIFSRHKLDFLKLLPRPGNGNCEFPCVR
jgi:hypothetical protein